MYRLTKSDDRDIGLAVSALSWKAITWEEFQAWIDHIVMAMDVDDLPVYIFDLLGCKTLGEMREPKPHGVFGYTVFDDLEDDSQATLWGIAYARKRPGLPVVPTDGIQPMVSREEAAAALARHPDVVEWFEWFFEATGKPGELSRSR